MPIIQTLAVIPARLRSVRLPEKPLIKLKGRELVLWVWEGVRESRKVDRVIVATDDRKIASLVERAGGEAMMTPDTPTGSDRVAYVARRIPSQFVLNVQGDDPTVSAAVIDPMIDALAASPETNLAVLAKKIDNPAEITKDSIVKMVFDQNSRALYFSRSPIPFPRNGGADYYKHIGPYAWRREALFEFASWPQTPLERCESLEMLRLLERGRSIMCIETAADSIEIDTPEDVLAFEEYYSKEG
ncbi:MAG: 3-deoxy-manno-octulosonate cytidylyltransferase [Synergistaceae bacterium]|jgi:3-deoxy-manno-octulosonate cytidylyltransferase (CMP-KDO synthetase)|nr:3-deoxy-manno-octulosonate cytidylyltransferase [Synergistaceae bacterium]